MVAIDRSASIACDRKRRGNDVDESYAGGVGEPMDDALPTAEPPDEFDVYEFVVLRRPEHPPVLDDEAADLLQLQHLGHLEKMRAAGFLKVAGPLQDQPDESVRGIALYQVGSIAEARRLAESDPAVRVGHLAVDVMHWYTRKGALRFEG
jgi:uncharacterized protein YciI